MRIFIAGCARSGTTAFRAQFRGILNAHVAKKETHFREFILYQEHEGPVVLKRTHKNRFDLYELPQNIRLLYCVRHPFDTLTSIHKDSMHRRPYHVTPKRWIEEFQGLQQLEAAQPEREIFFVPYERLVNDTRSLQRDIEEWLDLRFDLPFGTVAPLHARSVSKWRADDQRLAYLRNLPNVLWPHLRAFGARFGYDLDLPD